MARAVRVPFLDLEQDRPLDAAAIGGVCERARQRRIIGDCPRPAPDLHPPPGRIVDQEKEGPVILGKMTKRHELLVAREIGIAERLLVQHLEKAARAAPMLDIGPAFGIGGAHVEVIALGDELGEFGGHAGLPGHGKGFRREGGSLLYGGVLLLFDGLFYSPFNLLYVFGNRQIFRHSPTDLLDGLPNLSSDFEMGGIGRLFPANVFSSQLVLGLCRAEEVCRQFGAAHVIKQLLLSPKPLFALNPEPVQAAIKTLVAECLENGVVDRPFHAGLLGRACKVLVVGLGFLVSH